MSSGTVNISRAVDVLKSNLIHVARVTEWASVMGYNNPKKFSRKFLRYHAVRPQKMLEYIRLKSIIQDLRDGNGISNFEIARTHGIPDEKALNKFINYHLGCPPTDVKEMSEEKIKDKLEKLGSKVR
ncbi:MAG: helix-turn-helix domain-containing protein [Balneolaceae bacterium]|nr:helix-turn-helix domain-containing protein [Balneolaceae bacterium]